MYVVVRLVTAYHNNKIITFYEALIWREGSLLFVGRFIVASDFICSRDLTHTHAQTAL